MKNLPPNDSYFALDRLRAAANLLRCMLHTAVPYMVTRTGMWPLKEGNDTHLLPDVLVFIVHGSIMEIFYFVAGFLAIRQIEKRGTKAFLHNRFRKIIPPFVVAMLVLVPYVMFLFPIGSELEKGSLSWDWQSWGHSAFKLWSSNLFPTGHIWFLYYLIYYYAAILLLYQLWKDHHIMISKWLSPVRVWVGIWVISCICLYFSKAWYMLNPITTTVEWNSLFYFMAFFVLGIFTYYQAAQLQFAIRYRYRFFIVFAVMSLVAPIFQQFAKQTGHPYFDWVHIVAILITALHSVSGVGAAIGITHFISKPPSAWMQLMARSSYWVYLIHLPLVMTAHLLLFPLELPLLIKYLIALSSSLLVAIFMYFAFGKKLLQ